MSSADQSGQSERTVSIGSLPEIAKRLCDETLVYDAICKVARHYEPAAVCFVLEDKTDMQIKAAYGMPRGKLPLNSITRHVSGRPLPIIIEDTRADPRFEQDALVVGPPYARFYIGAPIIISTTDTCVGSLCIFYAQPRAGGVTLDECSVLTDAAQTIARHFEDLERGLSPRKLVATMESLPSIAERDIQDLIDNESCEESPESPTHASTAHADAVATQANAFGVQTGQECST